MVKLKLFALSVIGTAGILLTVIYLHRSPAAPVLKPVAPGLFVTSQLKTENVLALRRRGIRSIVDMRPDDEARDQTPSSAIKQAAEENGISFHYVPIPHGPVPKEAVEALQTALADRTAPTVLYCRTGNRAARALALVEASRTDGPSAVAINTMVRDADFSADDLKSEIEQRIAQRYPAGGSNQ
jgi:uncharacterized protein (TIGR01244 family)